MKKSELLVGKIENTLSKEEELRFQEWIDKSQENKLFYEYLLFLNKNGKGVKEIMSKDLTEAWLDFNKKQYYYEQRRRRIKRQRVLRYAALFIGFLLTIGYVFKDHLINSIGSEVEEIVTQDLIIPNEDIILKRENGEVLTLKEESNLALTNNKGAVIGQVKGNKLAYKKEASKQLVYNEIRVPYGKTFQLELSDKTIVYLNAGTSFKYPVNFIEGLDRKVFLLEGEAFFEVEENKNIPFLVETPHQLNIKVTGTKFNVSAYKEDDVISTVLVEGKVSVASKNNMVALLPNYKATSSKFTEEISTKIVNTDDYTAWIKGIIILKRTTFKKIRQRLERKYNVVILNTNSVLDEQLYNIYFHEETIGEVLESLKKTFDIKYKIENNTVIIN
ncbi:FecR family protein [Flavivirga spongiicola]|uniref:FecR family protein n=1 Tax=Flavivirga spongiicola TaxID=421621 RepID=A0ABU7XMR9_9FLAO|nr:FecR family protein [Flavivirga sp. MEBiC05379]MDO5981397.1 FecR family protein [Flavivirga sp. MEBiC05379]